jgi:outer membrane murein-binding lipoprotein Lpp
MTWRRFQMPAKTKKLAAKIAGMKKQKKEGRDKKQAAKDMKNEALTKKGKTRR